jgi:alpha-amylase
MVRLRFSSFEWETRDDRGIVAMVKWHNYVGNAKRTNFYTDDANVIAFSKDAKGWAAFNNGTEAKEIRVQTGLPAGTYCDIIHDKDSGKACDGRKVVVTSGGLATVTVGAKDAVAFTRADRISNVN